MDNRTADGIGYAMRTTADRSVEITLNDGRTESRWASDPGSLVIGKPPHSVAVCRPQTVDSSVLGFPGYAYGPASPEETSSAESVSTVLGDANMGIMEDSF